MKYDKCPCCQSLNLETINWTETSINYRCKDCFVEFEQRKIKRDKPPLGVRPNQIWYAEIMSERLTDLTRAIKDYTEANLNIPVEWITEYNELIKLSVVKKGEIK